MEVTEEPIEIDFERSKMFGGYNRRYRHYSPTLDCIMTFSVFFPPVDCRPFGFKCPILYWLSGYAYTDREFIINSGAQRCAAIKGFALVAPDTSPRGVNIEGEANHPWHLGRGSGWYLNAKNDKWKNWRMYDYVVKELPSLLNEYFEELDTTRASIFGHAMGGHGALTIYLKNLDKYKSVSAFAPIVNPINCPRGREAFSHYLGTTNESDWEEYDSTCLVEKFKGEPLRSRIPILIDQGSDDSFLSELQPHNFEKGVSAIGAYYELLSVLHPEENKPVAPVELCPILTGLSKIVKREFSPKDILQALRDETVTDPRERIEMAQSSAFSSRQTLKEMVSYMACYS